MGRIENFYSAEFNIDADYTRWNLEFPKNTRIKLHRMTAMVSHPFSSMSIGFLDANGRFHNLNTGNVPLLGLKEPIEIEVCTLFWLIDNAIAGDVFVRTASYEVID